VTVNSIAAIMWLLAHSSVLAQSTQEAERLLRDQEQRLGVSCRALHPKAHEFVNSHVAPLTNRATAHAALEQRFVDMMKEAREFADQTHKCYGLEPIALHSRLSFPSDFGELHEVLRHASEFINSFRSGEPEVARAVRLKELQKRMHELKTGTGRRYPPHKRSEQPNSASGAHENDTRPS
jgi:hypothetical protein